MLTEKRLRSNRPAESIYRDHRTATNILYNLITRWGLEGPNALELRSSYISSIVRGHGPPNADQLSQSCLSLSLAPLSIATIKVGLEGACGKADRHGCLSASLEEVRLHREVTNQ
jgi:hypothetical protein